MILQKKWKKPELVEDSSVPYGRTVLDSENSIIYVNPQWYAETQDFFFRLPFYIKVVNKQVSSFINHIHLANTVRIAGMLFIAELKTENIALELELKRILIMKRFEKNCPPPLA